jgi:transposase
MEGRQPRSFSDDYKRQAVDLVGRAGVAKELGLRDSVLRRWVEQRGARLEPTAATRGPAGRAMVASSG